MGLHDAGVPAPGHGSRALGPQHLRPDLRPVRTDAGYVDELPLGLRDDLAGHHQDVAVAQPRSSGGDHLGQVGPRHHLADPVHRQHLKAHATPASSIAAATMASVASTSVIHSGALRTRTPGTLAAASTGSTSHASSTPALVRAP